MPLVTFTIGRVESVNSFYVVKFTTGKDAAKDASPMAEAKITSKKKKKKKNYQCVLLSLIQIV